MTKYEVVKDDPKYIGILDKGFVGLVDYMGSDNAIVQAARVSYGDGTKTIREDRGLIRYLMRHRHTSPFEMCVVKFHLRIPIFVMRQLVRHRTSSLNEYSARYSIMTDDYYVPAFENTKPQSQDNKQGRSGTLNVQDYNSAVNMIVNLSDEAYQVYKTLLRDETNFNYNDVDYESLNFSNEYPGIARELARMVLPVNYYTELYWQQNTHNLLHLLKLRLDHHAQWEIQQTAQAMYDLIKPLYPITVEAFEDYIQCGKTFSKQEVNILKRFMLPEMNDFIACTDKAKTKAYAEKFNLSINEFNEFIEKFR